MKLNNNNLSEHDKHSHYHHNLVKFIFSKIKYPKIKLYFIFVALAYYFFTSNLFSDYIPFFVSHGYWSIFIAGLLFSYGFTNPFAIGIFVLAEPTNILTASIIAGFGALITDSLIFSFIRFNMMDEFKKIQRIKAVKSFDSFFHKHLNYSLQKSILYAIAGIIIASPLPDELGIMLLAGLSKAHVGVFAFVSFVFNTIGIFVILFLF
ncbi:hypothetical protein EXS72_01150 [Candidatus Pacearchaeota archaeon]|nr:hypothetical protein [Candidatus Pacearchaeota archaeon]